MLGCLVGCMVPSFTLAVILNYSVLLWWAVYLFFLPILLICCIAAPMKSFIIAIQIAPSIWSINSFSNMSMYIRHSFGPDSEFLRQLLFFFDARNIGDFSSLVETCRLMQNFVQGTSVCFQYFFIMNAVIYYELYLLGLLWYWRIILTLLDDKCQHTFCGTVFIFIFKTCLGFQCNILSYTQLLVFVVHLLGVGGVSQSTVQEINNLIILFFLLHVLSHVKII